MFWKRLLVLFFVLVIFEGVLRKWVLPGFATQLYFLKDGILLLAVAAYARRYRLILPASLHRTWLPFLMGLYGFIVLLQAFNLRQPALAVGILGVKNHLLYMVLVLLMPAALSQIRQPEHLLKKVFLFVFVPVLVLGVYQYVQPSTHWINRYVGAEEEMEVTNILGRARITGTFSYISGMATFLILSISAGLGLVVAGLRSGRRWLHWGGAAFLALTLTVAPMNGSRMVFFAFALPLPLLLWEMFRGSQRMGQMAAVVVGVAILTLAFSTTNVASGWETFMLRVEGSDEESKSRIADLLLGPYEVLGDVGFWGYGAGTTHQAAALLVPGRPRGSWLPMGSVETTTTRLLVELGAIGFLILMILKVMIAYIAYQVLTRAHGQPFTVALATTAFLFTTIHLYNPVEFNTTAGALYWGLVGAVVGIWAQQRGHVAVHLPRAAPARAQPGL